MGRDGVVFLEAAFGLFAYLCQRQEAPGIEYAVAVDAIKALNEGILRGLSRLGIFNDDAAGRTPGHEGGTRELRAVINTNPLWGTTYEQQLIESAGDMGCGQRDIDLNRQSLAVVVVDHVEGPEGSAVHECIAHEVGRPRLVRPNRLQQGFGGFWAVTTLEAPADVESHIAVHTPNALVVPGMTCLSQQHEQLVEAEPRMTIDQLGQCVNYLGSIGLFGLIAPIRPA